MLTAEEQWDIIQKEERRNGGRKKKKTGGEELEDMSGFGRDPDSEQALMEELGCIDTRSPLQYPEVVYEESFLVSRRRLFNSWIFQAKRPKSWIEEKDLPLFFRFALRRPIMDEKSLQDAVHAMNVKLKISKGNVRLPHTRPIGKSRQLMFGIDVDHEGKIHPSSRLIDILPTGATESDDKVIEDARRTCQEDDEEVNQLLRRQLWAVYHHVQDGSVSLETAAWHYRDAFSSQDITDEILLNCLRQFGIPTDHIPTNERSARILAEETASISDPGAKEKRTINELAGYIGLYRGGALQEDEVIPMIQHCLDGLEDDTDGIRDILTDLGKDEQMAALIIWKASCMESNALMHTSCSPSSSEEKVQGSRDEQENNYRPVIAVDPQGKGEKDRDAAVASPADENKSSEGPITEGMNHRDDIKENEPEQPEPFSLGQPLMGAPEISPRELSTHIHPKEAESKVQPPRTPRPKPESLAPALEEFDRQEDVEYDRERSRDRTNAGRRRSSSPENGMTTGIWGLLMPTKEARKLAYQMKLPQDTVDAQVRSISSRRLRRRRASHAENVVTFPKSKRKASIALHGDTPPKSPRHGDHSDLFAREGEDQEAFVLSHFDPGAFSSREKCTVCLNVPLECTCGPRSESTCFECLQQPCMCVGPSQVDKAIQTAPSSGIQRSDALRPELADGGRSEPPRQTVTLLTYLARVLEKEDVLASIKQLERLLPNDTTVADVKAILSHIHQGFHSGENIDITGDDDREAIRILDGLVQSRQTLTDYLEQLYHDASGEDHTTVSADGCDDGVGEGPTIRSSLPKNSPGHENGPTLPPSSVASTPAFLEAQSDIAKGPVVRANNTALATGANLPALNSGLPLFESSCNIEDAVQPSPFQAGPFPDYPAAGQPSRAENHSSSTAGDESSTGGGFASRAEVPPESPAGSPPSSTADLSKQVSDLHVDGEGDTDCDTFGAPLTRKPYSNLLDTGNSEVETRPPPAPRPGAKQLPINNQPSSPRPPATKLPKSKPPASARLKRRGPSKKMNATAQFCMKSPGFDSPPAQPGLPRKAGKEWMGMTPKEALEYAKKKAFSQRKSLAFYLEERRAVRTRIKSEINHADLLPSYHRFFQSSNGLSGSSGNAITPALNKLFDKYRGTFDIWCPFFRDYADTIVCQKT